MKAYFITSCGTDIGKTLITTSLCWHLKRISKKVQAIKPVASGWNNITLTSNDTIKILMSLGISPTQKNIELTSPWRFKHPLAPNMAAKLENAQLNYDEIIAFCQKKLKENYEYCFIEGVGGVMSPIADGKTCLDLIKDLSIKVIMVTGNYLGSISHTLTALSVLHGVDTKIVMNQGKEDNINIYDTINFISEYINQDIYLQKYLEKQGQSLWQYTANDILNILFANVQK